MEGISTERKKELTQGQKMGINNVDSQMETQRTEVKQQWLMASRMITREKMQGDDICHHIHLVLDEWEESKSPRDIKRNSSGLKK